MEIIPAEGVALARLGETRVAVESRVGAPVHGPGSNRAVYDTTPALVISYTSEDRVEIVEIAYSGQGREEVFFDGVQLTYRLLDDVVAELNAKGYQCTPTDIGFAFHAGFAVWSMSSLSASDLDPDQDKDEDEDEYEDDDDDDERRIVEGVSVAPYDYFYQAVDELD
jgi:hypothetical protein